MIRMKRYGNSYAKNEDTQEKHSLHIIGKHVFLLISKEMKYRKNFLYRMMISCIFGDTMWLPFLNV